MKLVLLYGGGVRYVKLVLLYGGVDSELVLLVWGG